MAGTPLNVQSFVGGDPAPFAELLARLSDPDTAQRTQAEAIFAALKEQSAEALVLRLLSFVANGNVPDVRALAATLLRQVLIKNQPSLWTSVSKPYQETFQRDILQALENEPERDVSLKVADVVAELFAKILGNECWPQLIPFLCRTIQGQHQSGQTSLVERCVYILAEIAPVLADSMEHSLEEFIAMMMQCLSNADPSIKIIAIKAVKCFAIALEDIQDVAKLKALMPEVLRAFSGVRFGMHGATEAYAIMIELAEYVPSLFEDNLRPVLVEFLTRAKEPVGEVDSKTMAMEFLLALIQGINEAEFEKINDCMAELVALLLEWLLQIEDAPDWYTHCGGEDISPDFGDLHELAIESVDRVASSVPSGVFPPLFSPYVQQWTEDGDWKKRHAVLSVIGQMAEGCSEEISSSVTQLLDICMQGLSDPHVRVRWAACQATGLIADEVGSLVQKERREHLIAQLIQASVIDDAAASAVQQHALHCLINVVQNSDYELRGATLDNVVLYGIMWILQSMSFEEQSVRQAALDCLTCLTSNLTAPLFAKYYHDSIKAVLNAMNHIQDPTNLEEISSIVEVMTQVGEASGKECFKNDYRFVVDSLRTLKDQAAQVEDVDDRTAVCINVLNALARVCTVMGTDFDSLEQFGDLILKALSTEPQLETVELEELEVSEESDPYKIDVAGKCFRIEKMSLAFCTCGMKTTMSIAQDLKHLFFPLLLSALEVFFPAMDYKMIKDIQHMSIKAQPILLECAAERYRMDSSQTSREFVSTLLRRQWESFMTRLGDMEQETNEAAAAVVIEASAKTIEALQGALELEMMQTLFNKVQHVLRHFTNLKNERSVVQEGELNADEMEEFSEEVSRENEVLQAIQKLVTALLTSTSDQYFPQISDLVSALHTFMGSLKEEESDFEALETILTVLTDICDYSQQGVEKYGSDVCSLFMAKLDHPYSGVRHISAFGLGVLAQKAPTAFQPFAGAALQKLAEVIDANDRCSGPNRELDQESAKALENAVSTVGKIAAVHQNLISHEDITLIYRLWLSHLPLKHDLDEAHIVHAQLLNAITNQDLHILGKEKENLARVVEILMEILANDTALATDDDLKRIPALLNALEHEQGCGHAALQKMQNWSEAEKSQFQQNMNQLQM